MDVWNSLRAREFQRVARVERAQVAERPTAVRPAVANTTTNVDISKSAEFLKSLSAFQQNDPKRFNEVVGAVASNLKAAANSPSGQIGSDLGKLADKLMVAANTGNLSPLTPGASAMRQGAMHRAVDAYRKLAPPAPPSQTVEDALEYVHEVVRDAGR